MSEIEEKIIEVKLQPSTQRIQTDMIRVPFGEIHRIVEVVCLDKTYSDVELALHVNGVRRGAVYALTVYVENNSRPMDDAFANLDLRHLDLIYFVATPTLSVRNTTTIRFRLKIAKSTDPMNR